MRRFCVPLLCAALLTPLAYAQAQTPAMPDHSPATASPVYPTAAAASTPASAPLGLRLSLTEALQTAARQNPTLRAAEAELAATQGAIDQAGVRPNPTFDFAQEDTRRNSVNRNAQLSQLLELGGKREARVAVARSGRDVAVAELANQQALVRAGTLQAFFDALIAQEQVQVAEESVGTAASGTGAASRRVIAGKVSPTEETRARVAEANARIELRQAQADQKVARRALSLVMGTPEQELPLLDGRIEALPRAPDIDSLAQRIAQAPALRRAQSEVQRANATYDLERAKRVPDITLSFGVTRQAEIGRTQPTFGVSIPLPFFDRNQGAQLEALRRRDAAEALAVAEKQRLQSEVLQTIDRLQGRAGEVEALREDVLPNAKSAYDAASRGFELGKFGFLDVLDAQRTLLQARTQYLRALADLHRQAAEVERQLGPTDRPTGIQP